MVERSNSVVISVSAPFIIERASVFFASPGWSIPDNTQDIALMDLLFGGKARDVFPSKFLPRPVLYTHEGRRKFHIRCRDNQTSPKRTASGEAFAHRCPLPGWGSLA